MRVMDLSIRGFRAFGSEVDFDLDADAVVVLGANGQGKTSLFDSLLWLLTGDITRLGASAPVVSQFSSDGEAIVRGRFKAEEGEELRLVRSTDGHQQRLLLEKGDESFRGEEAEVMLLKAFWPDALVAPDSGNAFTNALRRSVYLEQDRVREFIDADDDQARFNAVSELVGAGRVAELQRELERARKAWTTASNQLSKERDQLKRRLEISQQRLEQLAAESADSEAQSRWRDWWERASELGMVDQDPPALSSASAKSELSRVLGQSDAVRMSLERQATAVNALLERLGRRKESDIKARDELSATIDETQALIEKIEADLAASRKIQDDQHRRQLQVHDARRELGVLAELALRHLDKRCPVCQQEYEREATTQHLTELIEIAESDGDRGDSVSVDIEELAGSLMSRLTEKQQDLAKMQNELGRLDAERKAWLEESKEIRERLVEFEIDPDSGEDRTSEGLRLRAEEISERTEELRALASQGERLAVDLARMSEFARRTEIASDVERIRVDMVGIESQLDGRHNTGDLATQIIEELREAGSDVVEEELQRIEPILQRLYSRIDPHIAFRAVRFLTEYPRGRGRLRTSLIDAAEEVSTDVPVTVLSSSQMNALAVSVFMAFNLGLPSLPLQAAILDDPFQSLDDVNLLGLVDMLRRTKERRQLMLSTHDSRFAGLLERKLRPMRADQRTIVIELNGWSRQGPLVEVREISADTDALRIVA